MGWRLVWMLLLAVLLVYVGIHLWVRSPWFENWVEERLSELVGMEIQVGRIRATEALNLKLRDLIGMTELAGVEAKVVRVRWRLFRHEGDPWLESIRVDGGSITVAPDRRGRIQPVFLSRWMEQLPAWLEAGAVVREETDVALAAGGEDGVEPSSPLRMQLPYLRIQWGSVRICDAQGAERLMADGVSLERSVMTLPDGRKLMHTQADIQRIKLFGGSQLLGMHVEFMELDGRLFVVACEARDWGDVPQPVSKAEEYLALLDAMDE
jgi:hypothetical protein